MSEGYARFRMTQPAARWAVALALVAVAVTAAIFVARWGIAESIVDTAGRTAVTVELIDAARRLEPGNPETAYISALYALDNANPPDVQTSGSLLELAVELAPNRPEYWIALGRQREVAGLPGESERAFLRAVESAPWHWKPRWMLGNLYVRLGRFHDAVEPLREACRLNPSMAPLAARTIWGATGRGDMSTLQAVTSHTTAGRAAVVGLWVSEGRLDDALARWNELMADAGLAQVVIESGQQLAEALRVAGRGADYADISSRLNPERGATLDTIANAGFDGPISESETSPFAWKAVRSPEARVSVDAGHGGGKALRIDYNSKGGASFQHAAQTVRVEAGAAYVLSFWVTTEKLQTGGPPAVKVTDASGAGTPLGAVAVPTTATDWTLISLRFTAPPSGLVTINIVREACGAVCPILGTIRFDDVALAR